MLNKLDKNNGGKGWVMIGLATYSTIMLMIKFIFALINHLKYYFLGIVYLIYLLFFKTSIV